MNKHLRVWVVIALLLANGCARSSRYREEQNYYQPDSAFSSKAAGATSRAEKFAQPRKKIHVLPFMNSTPLGGEDLGLFASDELLRVVRAGNRAILPEDLRSADTSKEFYSGDKVRLGPLVREGKKLGVSLLILGKIKKIVYRTKGDEVGLFRQKKSIAAVDVEIRVFDVIGGREIFYEQKSADSTTNQLNIFGGDDSDPRSQRIELVRLALRNVTQKFASDVNRVLEKIGWEGRIAKIGNGRVYINAGRATGLNIGDILKVMTPGDDVYDPLTGAYMGRSQGQPKGTLEVVDYLGADGTVAAIHSGGNFAENDIVQLY